MPVCTKCKKNRHSEHFRVRNPETGTLRSHCMDCERLYIKARRDQTRTKPYKPQSPRIRDNAFRPQGIQTAPPEALNAAIRAFCGIKNLPEGNTSRCLITAVNRN